MKKHNGIICGSLAVLLALVGLNAGADMRAGKAGGYAGSSKNLLALQQQYQNQVAAAEAAAAAAAAEEERNSALAVEVADKELEEKIRDGDQDAGITRDTLDACANIIPGGEFAWDVPNMGRKANGSPTCVAVVELRVMGQGGDGEHIVAARAKVAAGEGFICNVSQFPKSTWLPDLNNVIFPADQAPTRQDVIAVMNQEQRNKAGLKIAAGFLVGGLGGNITGKNDPDKDGLLGTSKSKLKNTAIGAAGGAALMAASTFSGKVAGDMILHSGVNAIAGGAVGNMTGTGDDVLKVEKCKTEDGVETTCLWGKVEKTEDITNEKITIFYGATTKKVLVCNENYKECKDGGQYKPTTIKENSADVSEFISKGVDSVLSSLEERYNYDEEKKTVERSSNGGYVEVYATRRLGGSRRAVVVGFVEKKFGSKTSAWDDWKNQHADIVLCERDKDGNPFNCIGSGEKNAMTEDDIDNFSPATIGADSDEVIDFSNKARLGSTLKGAGIGAAAGGFSGYQGAQSDIDARLSQAETEYRASLQKIYCGTGNKFLEFYNAEAIVPALRE